MRGNENDRSGCDRKEGRLPGKTSFGCTEELREHMRRKGRFTLAVEVVQSNSDFEVTELWIHLPHPARAEELRTRKGYRTAALGEEGEVLLPPYRLEYDEKVVFDLKKTWIFRSITAKGVRL